MIPPRIAASTALTALLLTLGIVLLVLRVLL